MTEVIVVGYPKSGNTWTARLIADALDSPLVGLGNQAVPIGQEGLDRLGQHTVRQLHLLPRDDQYYDQAIPGPHTFAISCWRGEKIVLVIRDPRDVAVSCMAYWDIKTLTDTITAMAGCGWPIATPATWSEYNRLWSNLPVATVRYEHLLEDAHGVLFVLLNQLGIESVNDLAAVVERQSFAIRKSSFETMRGHWHPYGAGIQLKNMRKGQAGDWRNHFTRETARLFHDCFYEAMDEFGYEHNPDWWRELPEEM